MFLAHSLSNVRFSSHLCIARFTKALGVVRLPRMLTLPCLPVVTTPVEVAVIAQKLGFSLPVVVLALLELHDSGHDLLKERIILLPQLNFKLPILAIEAREVLNFLETHSIPLVIGMLARRLEFQRALFVLFSQVS